MPQFKYHNGTDWVTLGEENQNAFSQIQVGAFQIQADAKNDVLPVSGENGIDVFSDGNGLVISITGGVYEPKVINGTNTNGDYWKFTDGLLICVFTRDIDPQTLFTWTFPVPFSEYPYVNASGYIGGLDYDVYANQVVTYYKTYATIRTTSNSINRRIYCIAIGRWK